MYVEYVAKYVARSSPSSIQLCQILAITVSVLDTQTLLLLTPKFALTSPLETTDMSGGGEGQRNRCLRASGVGGGAG